MFSGKKKEKTTDVPRQTTQRPAASQAQKEEERPAKAVRPQRTEGGNAKSSTLNSHLSFQGDLRFSGTLHVDCELRGSIVTEDTLIVGSSARVDAEVTAGIVEISGKIKGNIKAKKSVTIHSGGHVQGNIETPSISMEQGVIFEGNCTRPSSAQQEDQEASQTPKRRAVEVSSESAPQAVTTSAPTPA